MPIAIVGTPTTANRAGTVAPWAAITPTTPTVGNTGIVVLAANGDDGWSAVTDTAGNTWTRQVQSVAGSHQGAAIFSAAINSAAGAPYSLTATPITPAQGGSGQFCFLEFSGLANTLDQTQVAALATGTSLTLTAPAPNVSASDLVIAVIVLGTGGDATAFSTAPTTGYTLIKAGTPGVDGYGSSSGYKIVTTTETSSAAWSWTTSNVNVGVLATFKAATTGGAPSAGPVPRQIYIMP